MRLRNEALGEVGTAVRKVLAGTNGQPVSKGMNFDTKRQDHSRHNSKGNFGTPKRGMVVMRR